MAFTIEPDLSFPKAGAPAGRKAPDPAAADPGKAFAEALKRTGDEAWIREPVGGENGAGTDQTAALLPLLPPDAEPEGALPGTENSETTKESAGNEAPLPVSQPVTMVKTEPADTLKAGTDTPIDIRPPAGKDPLPGTEDSETPKGPASTDTPLPVSQPVAMAKAEPADTPKAGTDTPTDVRPPAGKETLPGTKSPETTKEPVSTDTPLPVSQPVTMAKAEPADTPEAGTDTPTDIRPPAGKEQPSARASSPPEPLAKPDTPAPAAAPSADIQVQTAAVEVPRARQPDAGSPSPSRTTEKVAVVESQATAPRPPVQNMSDTPRQTDPGRIQQTATRFETTDAGSVDTPDPQGAPATKLKATPAADMKDAPAEDAKNIQAADLTAISTTGKTTGQGGPAPSPEMTSFTSAVTAAPGPVIQQAQAPAPAAAPMTPTQAIVTASPTETVQIITDAISAPDDRQDRVVVQLDPPELGRVSIDFKFDANGLQHVTITGDNPEALRQLRLMHFELTQALERNGLSSQNMSFQQHQSGQQQAGQGTGNRTFGADLPTDSILTAAEPAPRTTRLVPTSATSGGLNLKL